MYLKKHYKPENLAAYLAAKETETVLAKEKAAALGVNDPVLLESIVTTMVSDKHIPPPELDYIAVAHTGTSRKQNFSTSLVTEYVTLGLMEIHDGELFFKTHPETLRYKILRQPGRYCLHCGEKLSDDEKGELARLHVAMKHKGKTSPDVNQPSGYTSLTYFECELDEKQHEKYKAEPGTLMFEFPEKAG